MSEPLATKWLIRWSIWRTEYEPEAMFQGPYESRHEAETAASDAYPTIDPEHDPAWSVLPVHGERLAGIRYVEPHNGRNRARS
jgi:hypothetical protein